MAGAISRAVTERFLPDEVRSYFRRTRPEREFRYARKLGKAGGFLSGGINPALLDFGNTDAQLVYEVCAKDLDTSQKVLMQLGEIYAPISPFLILISWPRSYPTLQRRAMCKFPTLPLFRFSLLLVDVSPRGFKYGN